MTKIKHWFYNKFLPALCKEELLEANEKLAKQVADQQQELDRLQAYLNGMEAVLRRGGGRR